ncbi:MAG TPA: DUF2235 domain-containing protein [Steroidobacteraceae bacterium]|nr:DUF2235 domain-containing protein [Steroidobacteraceae bacterium]
MAKTIVFCADGTWNGPEEATGKSAIDDGDDSGELPGNQLTNVAKLYNKLSGTPTPQTKDLVDEQEKVLPALGGIAVPAQQVAKYMHGVGDSKNVAEKVLGGMFGAGIIARIVRGYTFISRNYQPGDAIYITGFSRGAYTARALAGMIARVGLLNAAKYDINNKEEAYKRGGAAWLRAKGVTLGGDANSKVNRFLDFVESSVAKLALSDSDLIPNVPIKAVGVWDTVGSLGVPAYIKGERVDLVRFVDTKLSDKVERGFHAMAIDEQRADFPVTPWDRRNGIEQVWFSGAHADVGGGYDKTNESFISDAALEWMLKKFARVGLRFDGSLDCTNLPKFLAQVIHSPWTKPPFNLLEKTPRQPHIEDTFHSTVVARWKGNAGYRPTALAFVTEVNVDRLATQA